VRYHCWFLSSFFFLFVLALLVTRVGGRLAVLLALVAYGAVYRTGRRKGKEEYASPLLPLTLPYNQRRSNLLDGIVLLSAVHDFGLISRRVGRLAGWFVASYRQHDMHDCFNILFGVRVDRFAQGPAFQNEIDDLTESSISGPSGLLRLLRLHAKTCFSTTSRGG
jgi:hypothetical protein